MVYFTPDELTFLLATDSAKAWILTNRAINNSQDVLQECDKDDLLIFRNTVFALDTLKVQLETGSLQCPGQADSIIYQGYWKALDSINVHYLQWVIKGDTSIRLVHFISSELLNISYREGNDQISEDFIADFN